MLIKNIKVQKGFTFTEIMIALAINLILFGVLIIFFIDNLQNYKLSLTLNRMLEQMQASMQLMSTEIRRAGFWGNASTDVGTHANTNPFVAGSNDISINGAGNCILFTYDHDANGSLAAVSSASDDERYGFRLNSGAIQARTPGSSFSCTASANSWENMTDTQYVTITALTFTLNQTTLATGPGTKSLLIRSVDITMTGQLANDSSITKTLTQHVRLRNDKFIP